MYFLLLLQLWYNFFFRATADNFKIYWGIPTNSCRKFKIDFSSLASENGIIQNANDSVRGNKVVIMYDPGSWPTISTNRDGDVIYNNGGLPQKGNLTVHLSKLEDKINEFIPNKTFDGLAVIDFEHWRPIFRQNFYGNLVIYRNLTLKEIRHKHPTWTKEQIEAQARSVFEPAAINFVNRTMMRAKKLRPHAKWGYYGFPHCFNRYRTLNHIDRCPEQVEGENNRLMSMFHNAIYPSIYITQNQTGELLTKYVTGKMYETKRISKQLGGDCDVLKLPFIRYQYTDTMNFMKESDMKNILKTIKTEGGDGAILWGSSSQFKSESQCRAFKSYVESSFISIVRDLRKL